MASEENETVKLLTETLESKVSMVQCVVTSIDSSRLTSRETFNTVVFFHLHEIDQDNQLLDLAAMLDVDHQVRTLCVFLTFIVLIFKSHLRGCWLDF
jgi:hypothetical protein